MLILLIQVIYLLNQSCFLELAMSIKLQSLPCWHLLNGSSTSVTRDPHLLQIKQSQGSREIVWKLRGLAGVLVYGLMARDLWFQLMLPSILTLRFKHKYSLVVLPDSTSWLL